MLFYNLPHYLAHPLDMLKVWQGGMSFHGGLIGVLLAMLYFARKTGKTFFTVADFFAPWVPIGLGLGRLGNFINHELWGRTTDGPWGMVFREAGPLPRHSSQLYQAALEGLALFVILWLFARKPRPTASVSGLFLICYGLFRILVEFVREPDPQLGYLAFGWLTMGQVLRVAMILFGAGVMVGAFKKKHACTKIAFLGQAPAALSKATYARRAPPETARRICATWQPAAHARVWRRAARTARWPRQCRRTPARRFNRAPI